LNVARAASPDPAFGYRVHAGRADVAQHGPDPGIGEDRVERGGEVRAAVADQELDPVRLLAEVHAPGWMQCGSENADSPGGVLDDGQHVGLGAVEQVAVKKSQARIASA
jgi:hypothetical protein